MELQEHEASPFDIKNKIGRLFWNVCYLLLFKYSPRPLHSWRAGLLVLFGARVGKKSHIYPKVKIWAPWNLHIGTLSCLADDVIVYNQGLISIGNNVVISQGTHLCAGTHDYSKRSFPLVAKSIEIGDEVWVAAEAFIHPGVSIGNGAVIGARSVVTKNIPEWKVAAGFPCTVIKDRFFID